jgi:predicted branched-subunit amino acid permease
MSQPELNGKSVFWLGFRAMLPLYLGVVPFALAYAITARASGLGVLETQSLSVLVFAGASQFSAAPLLGAGANGFAIVLTTFLLNVRHLLYGVAVARVTRMTLLERLLGAYILTDESFGVYMASGKRDVRFLLGASASLFVSWNVFTFVGAIASSLVPDPVALGVDLVFPLSFLALLIPLLKARVEVLVAVFSGVLAWGLIPRLPSGLGILLVGVLGSLLGAWLTRAEPIPQPQGDEGVP